MERFVKKMSELSYFLLTINNFYILFFIFLFLIFSIFFIKIYLTNELRPLSVWFSLFINFLIYFFYINYLLYLSPRFILTELNEGFSLKKNENFFNFKNKNQKHELYFKATDSEKPFYGSISDYMTPPEGVSFSDIVPHYSIDISKMPDKSSIWASKNPFLEHLKESQVEKSGGSDQSSVKNISTFEYDPDKVVMDQAHIEDIWRKTAPVEWQLDAYIMDNSPEYIATVNSVDEPPSKADYEIFFNSLSEDDESEQLHKPFVESFLFLRKFINNNMFRKDPKLVIKDASYIFVDDFGFLITSEIYLVQMVSIFLFFLFLLLSYFSFRDLFVNFEFYLLSFIYLFSFFILLSSNSFLNFYLSLELFGLISYVFVSYFKTNFLSVEASIKYFFFSSFASILLLLGISLIYLSSGVSSFSDLYWFFSFLSNNDWPSDSFFSLFSNTGYWLFNYKLFFLGLFFVLIAFFIKLGIAPFHFWIIDVYESLSFPLLFLFSVFPKLAYFFIIFTFLTFIPLNLSNFFQIFIFSSLLFGTIGGLFQTKINRLFAYSSVLNNGFFLLVFLLIGSKAFFPIFLLFYLNYCFLTFIIFSIFVFFIYKSPNIFTFSSLSDLSRLSSDLLISLILVFALFSLASVPPFAGFFVKFFLIFFVFTKPLSLFSTFFILLSSFLSSIYYLRLIKIFLFESPFAMVSSLGSKPVLSSDISFLSKDDKFSSFLLSIYLYFVFIFSFLNIFFICFLDTFFIILFF